MIKPGNPGLRRSPTLGAIGARTSALGDMLWRRTEPAQPPKAPPPPRGETAKPSSGQAEQLFEVVTLLTEELEAENKALRAYDVDAVRDLAAKKERLARMYNDLTTAVAGNPSVLDVLGPERRQELKAMAEAMDRRVETNRTLLQANMDACNRLMKVVVNAHKEMQTQNATYGAQGVLLGSRPRGDGNAIAYNKDI